MKAGNPGLFCQICLLKLSASPGWQEALDANFFHRYLFKAQLFLLPMSSVISAIQTAAVAAAKARFGIELAPEDLPVQETRKDFEGDFTLVVFALTKFKLGAPPQIGEALGQALLGELDLVSGYNVVKGFLNLTLSEAFWHRWLAENHSDTAFFRTSEGKGQAVVVEYCSPNTNKPLHLGHLRNIVLGYALTQILEANGYTVHPVCLFNDRGTNISKSMYAWLQAGKGETPAEAGVKGDKLVGDYYVNFSQQYANEVGALLAKGMSKAEADKEAPSMQAVHEMTLKWEADDPEVRALWEKMNGWVYEAFEDTFKRLGVSFDRFYYESQVYQRGVDAVEEGLEKGVFYRTEDGAVEVDLSDMGLDKKTLLRSNGTSLYITQDLAIARDKYEQYRMDKSIYVVGNEQDYHFNVLFAILKKLEKPYAEGLYHLSYGMVDLPSGKMKSREGTTVEADDLLEEMYEKAREESQKNPDKTQDLSEAELARLNEVLGAGALKYFLVKVDPKKRMLFDPAESIDLKGHTGPFIQYSYTRTRAVARKAQGLSMPAYGVATPPEEALLDSERILMISLIRFPQVLKEAAAAYNPALIANFAFELAKDYNRFYHEAKILREDFPHTSAFRFALSSFVGKTLAESMRLLGIEVPERM